ncbi:MAG: hypothetical protein AB4352_30070 [Hormoscilla sp.]
MVKNNQLAQDHTLSWAIAPFIPDRMPCDRRTVAPCWVSLALYPTYVDIFFIIVNHPVGFNPLKLLAVGFNPRRAMRPGDQLKWRSLPN